MVTPMQKHQNTIIFFVHSQIFFVHFIPYHLTDRDVSINNFTGLTSEIFFFLDVNKEEEKGRETVNGI